MAYSKKDLSKFSGEHLIYEIKMLHDTAIKLAQKQQDVTIANALVESFGIHANILLDFLFNYKTKKDDAIADYYLSDKAKWKEIIPEYRTKLKFIRKKRNKELAHLSFERLEVDPIEKNWHFLAIAREISTLIDCFIDEADKNVLHPNVYKLKGIFKEHPVCKSISDFNDLPLHGNEDNVVKSWLFK